jgi:thiol-disulfide isomerase/thioredoxin
MRSTNYPSYNINRDLFNSKDTINRYRNVDDSDSDFTFKKNYVIPNSYERNEDNSKFNRYKSPQFNDRRNLMNTRYGNYDSNNNNDNNNNKMNYSVSNNRYNNNLSNISTNKVSPSNNLYNSVSFNNDYKKFLENNMNRYNYSRNYNTNNDYFTEKRKMYSSPSHNFDCRRRNLDMTRRRYDYLRDVPEPEKVQCGPPKYNKERFIDLTQYNYRPKLLEFIRTRKTFFVHIFGSTDYTGKSWCSDCNIVHPIVEQGKKIIDNKKYEKEVYFLSIPIDKIYMEDFRDDPYIRLERVPTLILFESGFEKGKLIENDLFSYQKVREFILKAYEPGFMRQYLYERRNYY